MNATEMLSKAMYEFDRVSLTNPHPALVELRAYAETLNTGYSHSAKWWAGRAKRVAGLLTAYATLYAYTSMADRFPQCTPTEWIRNLEE